MQDVEPSDVAFKKNFIQGKVQYWGGGLFAISYGNVTNLFSYLMKILRKFYTHIETCSSDTPFGFFR